MLKESAKRENYLVHWFISSLEGSVGFHFRYLQI